MSGQPAGVSAADRGSGACRFVRRYAPSIATLTETRRRTGPEAVPHQVQIGEGKGRERAHGVLRQSAIAHLREAPQGLHYMERVLPAGTDAGARPIDLPPALGHGMVRRAPPIHAIPNAARLAEGPV